MRHKKKIEIEELKESIMAHGGIMARVACDFAVSSQTLTKAIEEFGLRDFRDEAYENSDKRHVQPLGNIEYAFKICGGIVADVAKVLDVDVATVYAYMRSYPHLHEVRQHARDDMLVLAEDTLGQLVRDGDWQAIKLVIGTQGRKLGYANTTNIVADGDAVTIVKVVYDE